jgi:hypothetical protein
VLAVLVDTDVVLKIVGVAFLAGVGITAVFGMVIYCTTRFADLRRAGRPGLGYAFGALAGVGLAAFVLAVVAALAIMTDK